MYILVHIFVLIRCHTCNTYIHQICQDSPICHLVCMTAEYMVHCLTLDHRLCIWNTEHWHVEDRRTSDLMFKASWIINRSTCTWKKCQVWKGAVQRITKRGVYLKSDCNSKADKHTRRNLCQILNYVSNWFNWQSLTGTDGKHTSYL